MSEYDKWFNTTMWIDVDEEFGKEVWNAALDAAAKACDRVMYEEGEHNNNICKAKILALRESKDE